MADIGKKIKELRTAKNLTLKELSEKTGLSTGFLSQLERGLTTAAIDTLERISEALGVDWGYFFAAPKERKECVVRSYERQIFLSEDSKFIHYHLSNDIRNMEMLPRMIEMLPSSREENVELYNHEGEEFIYILEGILTLFVGERRYELYPGDSAHVHSSMNHNWANYTNRMVKLISVNTPNKFKE